MEAMNAALITFGIAAVISMLTAGMIKVLVGTLNALEKRKKPD